MKDKQQRIGVVLCTCGGSLFTEKQLERISKGIEGKGASAPEILIHSNLCSSDQQRDLVKRIRAARMDKVVLAACAPVDRERLPEQIARKAGLSESAVYPVAVKSIKGKARVQRTTREIRKAVSAVTQIPHFDTREITLNRSVLVLGGGPAGLYTAAELHSLGYPTVVLEKQQQITGLEAVSAYEGQGFKKRLEGVRLQTGSQLVELRGQVGRFTARVAVPGGDEEQVEFGALVVATGAVLEPSEAELYDQQAVVPLAELVREAENLPRRREIRHIAIVLDTRLEETKASSELALQLAVDLQDPDQRQIYLFCREVRVSALGMQGLYDRARQSGVQVIKYEGPLSLDHVEGKLKISYRDAIFEQESELECDLAGISPLGLQCRADSSLAAILGLSTDIQGQLQDNNIHFLPEATNRPGIFVAGACRGQFYLPQISVDAENVAFAVDRLLGSGTLRLELSSPVVDPDKCILCLTCVRCCPYQAMEVDHEAGAAASIPEVCQRCGICAGECPARAITLPAWSEEVLLGQLAGN
jgi:heterodisulfide reductase subunit A